MADIYYENTTTKKIQFRSLHGMISDRVKEIFDGRAKCVLFSAL